jgi:hypothetical protein
VNLKGRIPVEPLDDERLTNIERSIVSRAASSPARAPRRLGGFALAGVAIAATAAAAVGGWKLHRAPEAVAVAPLGVHGETIDIGDATIAAAPGAEYAVTRPDGGVLVALAKGKVELHVAKRGSRPPLVVRAADTDVVVVGTRFSVDVGGGAGPVDVRVSEGLVRVEQRGHDEARVAAGQAWRAGGEVVAMAEAPKAAEYRWTGDGKLRTPGAPCDEPGTDSDGVIDGSTPRTREPDPNIELDARAPDVLHGRTSAVPTVAPGAGNKRATAVTAEDLRALPAPRRPTLASIHEPPRPQNPLFAQLANPALLLPPLDVGAANAADAVAKLKDRVFSLRGAEASTAYYSLAFEQVAAGRSEEALRTLDLYFGRFDDGKEYPAALWLRVKILCTRRLDETCKDAAARYLRRIPDGEAAHLAELITLQ